MTWDHNQLSKAHCWCPKEDPHTRDCEGCDVARSNGEHKEPREAQWNNVIEEKYRESAHPGQGQRDSKKAKEEAVKNVAESMHECRSRK